MMLKRRGTMDDFEIRISRLILLLIAPGLYIYSVMIGYLDPDRIEISGAREVLFLLFFVIGLIPIFYEKWSEQYYGHLVFFSIFIFSNYLIYTAAINNFELHYLLGAYVVLFGGILLLAHRTYILVHTFLSFVHISYALHISSITIADKGAILLSLATIFIFSFFIQNGFISYKNKLKQLNFGLETKVKLRTKDLEHRAKELLRKNKELEEFSYVVSHDIKRPIKNVHSLASWVEQDLNSENKVGAKENLNLLMEQVAQMELLVDGILKYSLGIEKKSALEWINVDELVDSLILTNNSEEVQIEKVCSLPKLLIDQTQILQVFQNLVQNAIVYNQKPKKSIQIGVIDDLTSYTFYVRDNGMGIASSHYERIFKLFQRLDIYSNQDSSGIGLAVVKKIIDKNGGEVWVESIVDQGSTFYFKLHKKDVYDGCEIKKESDMVCAGI